MVLCRATKFKKMKSHREEAAKNKQCKVMLHQGIINCTEQSTDEIM